MAKITALKLTQRKGVNVYLDGSFAFTLNVEVADRAGLKVGQELSSSQICELKEAELLGKCLKAAMLYLSYRPRSEAEIRQRLYRRSFDSDTVQKTVIWLREQRLIDDMAFARFWVENRLLFKPLSQKLLSRELWQKGVAKEIMDEVTQDVDDKVNALKAGRKRVRHLAALDYPEFRFRLANYLRRRGFSYDTINFAVEHLWRERQNNK